KYIGADGGERIPGFQMTSVQRRHFTLRITGATPGLERGATGNQKKRSERKSQQYRPAPEHCGFPSPVSLRAAQVDKCDLFPGRRLTTVELAFFRDDFPRHRRDFHFQAVPADGKFALRDGVPSRLELNERGAVD